MPTVNLTENESPGMETLPSIPEVGISPALSLSSPLPTAMRSRLTDFYELTKPRMNFLVVVTTMVGYYMAAHGPADWLRVLYTLVGTALTAAGSSVFNQYIERDLDLRMPRTANRPLPGGDLRAADALLFGFALSLVGVGMLALFVNGLTALLGALTLLLYVFVYTPAKRSTSLCTIIGAVPGAIPPVMGFTAVQGAISPQALALFAILFFWQNAALPGHRHPLPRQLRPRRIQNAPRRRSWHGHDRPPDHPLLPLAGDDQPRPRPAEHGRRHLLGCGPASGHRIHRLRRGLRRSKTRSDARQLFLASIVYLPVLLAALMIDKL